MTIPSGIVLHRSITEMSVFSRIPEEGSSRLSGRRSLILLLERAREKVCKGPVWHADSFYVHDSLLCFTDHL